MELEEMSSFFNSRVDMYDEHMLRDIEGMRELYEKTAKLIPRNKDIEILDLGCGTGLELDEIFKVNEKVKVTGIDMSEHMVEKIKEKHKDKIDQLNLVIGDYFEYHMEENKFHICVSVESLHHFTHEEKVILYRKILKSLKKDGLFIETDYLAKDEDEEDKLFKEKERIIKEQGLKEGLYHFDTPCTIENEKKLLIKAGFKSVEISFRCGNTAILIARK